MKAFLLAAGLGTRLRPVTEHTPKCLLPIGGQPLLDIWLDAMARAGVDEVLVNLHHLPDQVTDHLADRRRPPVVRTVFEAELLGSAGTLWANREWVAGEEMFLAVNADNLTDFDLRALIEAQRAGRVLATLALFKAPEPSACGIVEIDADGLVVGFVEKPPVPTSDLANAGLYAFHPSVIDLLAGAAAHPPLDIGYQLLPHLVGRARTVLVAGYFRDIGTIDAYRHAQADWPAGAGAAAAAAARVGAS